MKERYSKLLGNNISIFTVDTLCKNYLSEYNGSNMMYCVTFELPKFIYILDTFKGST